MVDDKAFPPFSLRLNGIQGVRDLPNVLHLKRPGDGRYAHAEFVVKVGYDLLRDCEGVSLVRHSRGWASSLESVKGNVLGRDADIELGDAPPDEAGTKRRRVKSTAGGDLHRFLRRGLFFSHRDIGWILDEYARGNKFFLYTGRGPSGPIHIGHLVPWILTQWLQEKFDVDVYFQLTDDEKYLFDEDLELEDTAKWAVENALDFLALGFKPDRTFLIWNTRHAGVLYPLAIRVAKRITFSTARAVFGFEPSANVGRIFFTSMQAVPAFLPSALSGRNVPCLVPMGIDQDPHFRVARDVLPRLGYLKPAALHSKFVPALSGPAGKMSASDPSSAIYTTDSAAKIRQKVMKYAFSGGQSTVEEHRRLGGNPDIDSSFQWLSIFEDDDKKLADIAANYRSGSLLSGELKMMLVEKLTEFLTVHQERRESLRPRLNQFLLKT